jgi:hypothetical protein
MISQSHFQLFSIEKAPLISGRKVLFLSIFIVYVGLRLLAWQETVLVEDHDSLVYLDQIKTFRTLDLEKILSMGGFTTQFYPFCAALLSWPGWSVETSARLCSMIFSLLLFLSVLGLGNRIAESKETALALAILTFSPVLILFSFSILAEPSYVATIYIGLWVFWTQYENPKLWKAGLLGVIFGLGFLNRTEGLLNLFVVPLMQGVLIFLGPRRGDSVKRFVGWTTVFMLSFSLLAGAQTWRVSHKFGYFAIDERQVWTVTRQTMDGKSYEEQINGLDFSPSQTNLDYIRAHPEVQEEFASNASLKEIVKKNAKTGVLNIKQYVKAVVFNVDSLEHGKSSILPGLLGLLFFAGGLFALYKSGRQRDAFLVLAFIAFNSVGPLLYQVQIRYIAIIFPLMMLVEGIGIVHLAGSVAMLRKWGSARRNTVCLVFFLLLLGAWSLPLSRIYTSPKTFNGEYSPEALREPALIIKSIAQKELLRPPIVSARKGYLIYYADADPAAFPYTNIDGLKRFYELNQVDFLFLEYRLIKGYPFLEAFTNGEPPFEFALLHRGTDPFGERLELYRYQRKSQDSCRRTP